MRCPKAALFDLDDTLAPTLQAPSPEVVHQLQELMAHMPVAIMTGRDFPHIQDEFLGAIASSELCDKLYILASGASQGYRCEGGSWQRIYSYELTPEEKTAIHEAVEASTAKTGVMEGLPCYGARYVDKGSMVSFAMLGVPLPKEVTREWDPGNEKRGALWRDLAPRLPDFDVSMGGMTAIDISRKGINKAFGVRWLSEKLGIAPEDMLFIGDAIYEGGNDFIVKSAGVATRSTSGPEETAGIITEILAECRG